MSSPYTTFGLPPDGVAWAALAAACMLGPVWSWQAKRAPVVAPRLVLPALALGAALLSAGYVVYYLHSGPRIIDATSYYLQARAFAHGFFSFPVLSPTGSFRGRFLIATGGQSLAVIFPPGYALLLAAGFLVHAPLSVGPLLAALIVIATYALAKEITGRQSSALLAASLSLSCAALRYHTADTMSHGLCALLLCTATVSALRARLASAALSGLAIGWLVATRPISGVVAGLLALSLLKPKLPQAAAFAAGLVPGVALLLLYQRAATGSYFGSPQLLYYGLADGPVGCFRYGFGPNIGCLHEHGDFVRARLPNGYGAREAIAVTLRRLALHGIDIANAVPLALLVPLGAFLGRAERGVRAIFFGCLGLICAYAPFYFDASYPGAGARLFADLLPLEHVLIAIAVVRLRVSAVALSLSLLGFACHASFSHRALADREGGRPMFEASALSHASVDHGLVFVDTDHGFNLGHDPGQFDAQRGVVVARYQHDAHDWLLWNRLGRPPSYRYEYRVARSNSQPDIARYTPPEPIAGRLRFEAESEWPPLAVIGGWVEPDFVPCASGGRGLRLHPNGPPSSARIEFEISVPDGGTSARRLRLGWVQDPGPTTVITLTGLAPNSRAEPRSKPTRTAEAVTANVPEQASRRPECVELELGQMATSLLHRVRLDASRPGVLDYVEVVP